MDWLAKELSKALGFPEDEVKPIVDMVEAMPSTEERVAYVKEILGYTHPAVAGIMKRLNAPAAKVLRLTDAPGTKQQQRMPRSQRHASKVSQSDPASQEYHQSNPKLMPAVKPEPRVACDCLATIHGLFTNCLSCGKILCQKEGPGPCTFCGEMVENRQQQAEMIAKRRKAKATVSNARTSYRSKIAPSHGSTETKTASVMEDKELTTLFPKLGVNEMLDSADDEAAIAAEMTALQKAEQHRNKLLEFDRLNSMQSRIHDQAEDYRSATTDMWLSPEERAIAVREYQLYNEHIEKQKRQLVVTLDLTNSSVVEEKPITIAKPNLAAAFRKKKKP